MDDKRVVKKSRFLSMVLRHKPKKANIILDNAGWTDVKTLLNNINMDMTTLEEVVAINNKKRFEFSEDKTRIRARQGHSINVDLGYEPQEPPEFLYHGTATRFLESILKEGLKPMGRHQVHLSQDLETASAVGKRHGKLVILKVNAQRMAQDGAKFYITDNEVWLTDRVLSRYLEVIDK
jgi:putative RNA 2'-phosphotransferase